MDTETNHRDFPVLAIAYDDMTRSVITSNLASFDVRTVQCSTFSEAENYVLHGECRGILVDLMAMVKAKAEEKAVAYTLTEYYPTLRVRAMGMMIVPMAMAGDAKQARSVNDFLTRNCAEFKPRGLRAFKRTDLRIPAYIDTDRGYTRNISCGGAFVSDVTWERFPVGKAIAVNFPDFGIDVEGIVVRTQTFGQNHPAGIGVKFKCPVPESKLFSSLKTRESAFRDNVEQNSLVN